MTQYRQRPRNLDATAPEPPTLMALRNLERTVHDDPDNLEHKTSFTARR